MHLRMRLQTPQFLPNLFGAMSDQWELWVESLLFLARGHGIRGCVCFYWTCWNGHFLVGGGLRPGITWPCGSYAFSLCTQELSRHISHSQSCSQHKAEVKWDRGVRVGLMLPWLLSWCYKHGYSEKKSRIWECGRIRGSRRESFSETTACLRSVCPCLNLIFCPTRHLKLILCIF